MFCLCKDTREELWHGDIEQCNNNLEHIDQLFIRIQDLLLSLNELWLKNPEEPPPTLHEVAYNYPIGNKVRYTTDPDYDPSIHSMLGRKKTSLLSESRIFQFKELLKKTASKKGGWKSVNAAVEEMISIFLDSLEKQAHQTAELFKQGRLDFIKLYKHAENRLQIELEENAWLNSHSSNQERRELAEKKMGYLCMLIEEQQSLYDALKQNDHSKINIDGYQSLLKSNYSVDTLSDWIRNDKVLLKEILRPPKSSKEKSKK